MKYLLLLSFVLTSAFAFSQNTDSPFQNLHQVSDSVYRSDQPDSLGMVYLENNDFKSILNVKTKQTDSLLASGDLNLFFVKMHAERIKKKQVLAALIVLRDAPKPLVIHCRHGSDRTGLIIALYRILFQDYTKEQAIDEMKNGNFGFHPIFFNIPRFIKKIDIEEWRAELQTKPSNTTIFQ